MEMTMEDLEREMEAFGKLKEIFIAEVNRGTSYDEFRIGLIKSIHCTWGAASDTIDVLEKATGLTLPGYRPMPVPKRRS